MEGGEGGSPALDFFEYIGGLGGPDKELGLLIVLGKAVFDGNDQFAHASKHTPAKPLRGEIAKESLHHVQSRCARRLGVAQQSVSRWAQQAAQGGPQALRHPGRAGRKPQLSAAHLTQREQWLLDGPQAPGYPTPWWTGQRVRRLIKEQFGIAHHPGHVWKILVRLGGSPPRPVGRARQRNEDHVGGIGLRARGLGHALHFGGLRFQ